ncbi:hypothetical protein JOF53_003057 [Crossiella equi]|uniref:Uncharacterized protein n=1 Tax=Crossiella equi TaxID=130796 RepID=A0ABS5AC77_9PSEU|nr:hypothetical protein [Crossiella equi]MBP2474185.1 hypothetical protein [Crossiella equi]
MGAEDPLRDHPDFTDPDWRARAEKAGRDHVRKIKRRAFWRRNGGRFLGLGLVVALGVTGVVLYRNGALPDLREAGGTLGGDSGSAKPGVDLTQPFLGTEAGPWPDGVAGLVVPEAPKLGKYSPEQVKAFGEQVRTFLLTSRLDRRVLEGGEVGLVLDQLPPEARVQFEEYREKEKIAPEAGSFLHTRIAPGYKLLPVEPKVKGEMKFQLDGQGRLTARTNYVIAYAFAPEQPEKITDPHEIIAIQRREAEWVLEDSTQIRKSARGLWWGEGANGYDYLMSCEEARKEYLAPTYRETLRSAPTTGPGARHERKHYFDPNSPIDDEDGCK